MTESITLTISMPKYLADDITNTRIRKGIKNKSVFFQELSMKGLQVIKSELSNQKEEQDALCGISTPNYLLRNAWNAFLNFTIASNLDRPDILNKCSALVSPSRNLSFRYHVIWQKNKALPTSSELDMLWNPDEFLSSFMSFEYLSAFNFTVICFGTVFEKYEIKIYKFMDEIVTSCDSVVQEVTTSVYINTHLTKPMRGSGTYDPYFAET